MLTRSGSPDVTVGVTACLLKNEPTSLWILQVNLAVSGGSYRETECDKREINVVFIRPEAR